MKRMAVTSSECKDYSFSDQHQLASEQCTEDVYSPEIVPKETGLGSFVIGGDSDHEDRWDSGESDSDHSKEMEFDQGLNVSVSDESLVDPYELKLD